MVKCECGHVSSFHPSISEKKGGLSSLADGLSSVFGSSAEYRACRGETKSGKPCPCVKYTVDK